MDGVGALLPEPVFGALIKVGMSETLSFVGGFVYGPIVGFITGFMIILLSDIAVLMARALGRLSSPPSLVSLEYARDSYDIFAHDRQHL